MPDWSYQPIFRPLLFRLPATRARDLTLNLMGYLGRMPLGGQIISFMGHMRPDARLRQTHGQVTFPSGVGLGLGIDSQAVALDSFSRFGFGFMEVGPVVSSGCQRSQAVARGLEAEGIIFGDGLPEIDLANVCARLAAANIRHLPLLIRLGHKAGQGCQAATDETVGLIAALHPYASYFSLNTSQHYLQGEWTQGEWQHHLSCVIAAAAEKSILIPFPAQQPFDRLQPCLRTTQTAGVMGYIVDGYVCAGSNIHLGPGAHQFARNLVWEIRHKTGAAPLIVASGGVHEPAHALDLIESGANLVQVDSGLVYSGPGLPKRINEAMLHRIVQTQSSAHSIATQSDPAADHFSLEVASKETWFWTMLLGIAMFIGGLLAIVIAATRVILPYDESFVGLSVTEIAAINDRLLPFLAHDRITLAGTMIAIGWFYFLLSVFGVRRGHHWAKITILYSAMPGFFSFFLFLGFSYFDPFHAFVTAIMFQFLLFALHSAMSTVKVDIRPNLRNDQAWRRSLWAQLLFLAQGTAITTAGFTISFIGITRVFVPEDLAFMQTTAEALWAANPRLVPLIAHDRATVGGMLISSGISIILATLWGFRQGERWLWWGLCLSSTLAFAATTVVHFAVGYTDLWHLSPVFAGQIILVAALWLSYPYLCADEA